MTVTRATSEDTDRIIEIIEEARSFQLSYGNKQWAGGYPSRTLIEEDIKEGIGYKILVDDEIAGYMAIVSHDDSYARIEGRWITAGPYIAIHRLALSDSWRGKGLFSSIIEEVVEIGKENGAVSLRIDTDKSNPIMKHLLQAMSFLKAIQSLLTNFPLQRYKSLRAC